MRVGTFNVQTPFEANWSQRQQVIADSLARLDLDVLALQEVSAGEGRDGGIEELLEPGWHLAWHSHTTADEVGLVLASRWPLGQVREHSLNVTPRTVDFPWSAVVLAEVLAPNPVGPFWVAHHKPLYQLNFERERELQAVSAAEFIDSSIDPAQRVILLGDFDAPPDSASVRFWTGRQSLEGVSTTFHDVWSAVFPDDPGYTFTPVNPLVAQGAMGRAAARRIDYVMVRGDAMGPCLRPVHAERFCVDHRSGIQASDHYGVFAELAIE